jgi:acyl-CoA synthetase (AMP-forming)/AMP-acid ligase II
MKKRPLRLLHETLLAAAEEHPEKTAVIVDGVSHSYQALLDAALRLARAFQERGLRRGDRVAIYLDNSWPCVVAIYATLLAGGAVVVINPQTKVEKLAYMLADSGAAILVLDGALLGGAGHPLEEVAAGRHLICTGPAPAGLSGVATFEEVLAGAASIPAGEPPPRAGLVGEPIWPGPAPVSAPVSARSKPALLDPGLIPLDLAALIYTSGSTGVPKGVMMTHQSMLFAAGSIAEYLRLGAEERILNVLPLAFDYGLYQLLISVYLGATLVLERSFTYPVQIVERARQEEVTVFPGVPTIFATLRSMRQRSELVLPSVRRVTNTAAALPADFIPECRKLFPNALIFAMYGLTECKRVSYLEPELLAERPTSVGRAIPGTEVYLLSPEGRPVPPGEPGILYVRGPHLMLGYWGQPELSAQMLRPGRYPGERVLCTQDYFRQDDEGFLYFVGRSDDIIKTRGEKVSPVEVEGVLHAIVGVREAAVVGVPDEALGQAIHAFVVLEKDAGLNAQEIKRHCRLKLEAFMVPQEVVFLEELPKTATAKVRKESLRTPAEAKPSIR